MHQISADQVVRNEHSTIPYTWIRHEQPSKNICIMLPGLGYSTDRPIFYYATSMCLNNHVDVLHINYTFAKNEHFKKQNEAEQESWMYEDVKAVIKEVLRDTHYEQSFLLSKSIGTIPMAKEWTQKNLFPNALGIWLTPLLKVDTVYQAIMKTERPSLCVIGDADHHYIEEKIASLKNNELVNTLVTPKADHSLEIPGDIIASIHAANEVIAFIQEFIIRNKI
ncbi:alpha/beta family hydrolase [Neobacillus drentensis]|uniref:alpha/beta family hydrolase n=1 Tax=Neobacillus drentensis TaxID=220684 RepID=UPI003002AE49